MPHSSTTLTLRIDQETKDQLSKLANLTGRSKSNLAACAIKSYVDNNVWQIEGIKKAIEDADSGKANFIDHHTVEAWLNGWGTAKAERGLD